MSYMSAYAVTRHYGGPEEGGWWFNWYDHIESTPVPHPAVKELVRDMLRTKYAELKVGDIYSVLGGVDVEVFSEEEPGELESTERPHYE